MSTSALIVLDSRGKNLISRNYRGDIPLSVANTFIEEVILLSDSEAAPVVYKDGITFVYVKHNNLFFLSISELNINVMMTVQFIHSVINTLTTFFGEVCEESIRDNFVVIYELLDEMMDFGYPQMTDTTMLQNFITQESHKLLLKEAPSLLRSLTGQVSWRKEGIKHDKNEIFVDVIEKVNLLVGATGNVLSSEIIGTVRCKSLLSGMPELRLALNDRVQFNSPTNPIGLNNFDAIRSFDRPIEIEDVNFHQCVRLNRFDQQHAISFIPPDGEFDLMTYRLNTEVRPLFWVEALIECKEHSRIEILVKVKSSFRSNSAANQVEVSIPVPSDAHSPKYRASNGSCAYVPEKQAVVWSIKSFPGSTEYILRAHLALSSLSSEETLQEAQHRPISVQFEIPYFTVSGLQVLYLKVLEKTGYNALPWIRYITRSGDYQIRT